ncbi:ATP-dependent Clp protease, protease subunit [Lachnospiraceae bacterium NE2001]|nr:ATP-dependent Clp protease, protease subunit [Lachnospiraceae bacterium NE2001]
MLINPVTTIEGKDGVRGTVDTFSRNYMEGNVYLVGEIEDEMAMSIVAQLLDLDYKAREAGDESGITLIINSPGGSVSAGLAIYDTMRSLSTPVRTLCVGMAASMAAVILAGGDTRMMMPHSEVMIHQPSGGANGKTSDILVAADHIRDLRNELNKILSERTGKSVDEVARDTELDKWLKPEEALSYGLIDAIYHT